MFHRSTSKYFSIDPPLFQKTISSTLAGRTPLIQPMRKEKGCLSYNAFLSIEDENGINLVEERESREDLDNHLRSDRFGALLGARSLLNEPPEIRINSVSYASGMESVKAARGR